MASLSGMSDWKTFEAKSFGLSLRLPPGWKEEGQSNGGKPYRSDPDANKSVGQVQLAISAVSPVKASHTNFPDTFTAVIVAQAEPQTIDDKYAAESLADLKASYPSGDARVQREMIPAGPALKASYKDEGTIGDSGQSAPGAGKIIDVTNVQVRTARGRLLYIIQLTGSSSDRAALEELADKIASTLKLD